MQNDKSFASQNSISVIIVTYNNQNEIGLCLSSLIQATRNIPSQIILIDNASQDNTWTIIKEIHKKSDNINLIENNTNLGFTKAVNQGLKIATGNFILLLNPDTSLPANIFDKLLPRFKNDPTIGIISPQFLNEDKSIQPSCRRFPKHRDIVYHILGLNILFHRSKIFNGWKMGDFDHKKEQFVDQPQGAFLLTTREAFQEVGLLDESFPMFFSDVDWCRRYTEKDWHILFTPEIQITHLKGSSVYKRRIPLIWSSHHSFYKYFKKYYKKGFWPIINFLAGILLFQLAFFRTLFSIKFKHEK